MNTIKTVGDLRKALSAYDQKLPLEVAMIGGVPREVLILNNDTQIYGLVCAGGGVTDKVVIELIKKT